jgi:hypothetical protein
MGGQKGIGKIGSERMERISEYALLTHHVHSEDALLPLDELFEAPALLVISPCSMEPSNGVMSSQSNNVVTFVWSPIYKGIMLETRSKIISLRIGL